MNIRVTDIQEYNVYLSEPSHDGSYIGTLFLTPDNALNERLACHCSLDVVMNNDINIHISHAHKQTNILGNNWTIHFRET